MDILTFWLVLAAGLVLAIGPLLRRDAPTLLGWSQRNKAEDTAQDASGGGE